MEHSKQDRYYFHSAPRTASTVLLRILNLHEQPNLSLDPTDGYFFISFYMHQRSLGLQGKNPSTWTPSETSQIQDTLRGCYKNLALFLQETDAKGESCFIKEHGEFIIDPSAFATFLSPSLDFQSILRQEISSTPLPGVIGGAATWSPGNHTVLPDELLQTCKPTILIRHPALVFPSKFRAFIDLQQIRSDSNAHDVTMTMKWAREIYSLYAALLPQDPNRDGEGAWPVILEADEALTNRALLSKYCKLLGFEEEKLTFTWEVAVEGDVMLRDAITKRFADTLNASTGLLEDKLAAGKIDVDVEAGNWREEFGEDNGREIERWVREAMPDYEFMMARRLRV